MAVEDVSASEEKNMCPRADLTEAMALLQKKRRARLALLPGVRGQQLPDGLEQGARGPEVGHLGGKRLKLGHVAKHGRGADDPAVR